MLTNKLAWHTNINTIGVRPAQIKKWKSAVRTLHSIDRKLHAVTYPGICACKFDDNLGYFTGIRPIPVNICSFKTKLILTVFKHATTQKRYKGCY